MMHRSSGKRNDASSGISASSSRDSTILRKEVADSAASTQLDHSNSDHRKKKSVVLLSMLAKGRMKMLLLAILLLAAMIWYWNQRAIWKQQQAPLDHIGTLFLKPIWALTCPDIDTDVVKDGVAPIVVPVVMISARTVEQVQPVYETWSQNKDLLSRSRLPSIRFSFALFNTTEYSRKYVNTRCRHPRNATFASRLFAVYQHVFATLLSESVTPSNSNNATEYFVIVEDDTILLDGSRLAREVAWAIHADVGFYSFNPFVPSSAAVPDQGDDDHAKQSIAVNQKSRNATKREGNDTALRSTTVRRRPSCVYQFSTTAQVISRRLMQQIVNADTDSFCRLPIDMYIARLGPWYASVHAVTRHIGKRLILSQPKVTSSNLTTNHSKVH